MSSYLNKDGERLMTRSPVKTWWLTGFKMDGGTDPSQLIMGMNITFKDSDMKKSFTNAFETKYSEEIADSSLAIQYSKDDTNNTVWIEWRG